jgi:hypothetical protein
MPHPKSPPATPFMSAVPFLGSGYDKRTLACHWSIMNRLARGDSHPAANPNVATRNMPHWIIRPVGGAMHLIHMFPGRWKAYTHPPSHTRNHSLPSPARQRQGPNATFGPANQNTWLRVQNEDENARDADFTRFTQFGGYFCPVIVYVGHDRVQPRKGEAKTRLNQNIREHTLTHTHTQNITT